MAPKLQKRIPPFARKPHPSQNIAMAASRKKRPKQKEEKAKTSKSPESQLDAFLDKYTPEVGTIARGCLKKMRSRLPGATQIAYDNYNALAIGFGPSETASEAIFSIVLYPRYVTLFFLQGARLPDPKRLLQGSGKIVRHIRLELPTDLDQPAIRELMLNALQSAKRPIDHTAPGGLVIKSVSAKQRPRRPGSLPS